MQSIGGSGEDEQQENHFLHDLPDPEDLGFTKNSLFNIKTKSKSKDLGDVSFLAKQRSCLKQSFEDPEKKFVDRMGSKYAGVKLDKYQEEQDLSRDSSDENSILNENDDEELSFDGEGDSFDGEDLDSSVSVTGEEYLGDDFNQSQAEKDGFLSDDLLAEANAALPALFASARQESIQSGRALRSYYAAYSECMQTRTLLQPLLQASNSNNLVDGLDSFSTLKDLIEKMIPVTNKSDADYSSLDSVWEKHLSRCHESLMQEAKVILKGISGTPLQAISKKSKRNRRLGIHSDSMQLISQSPWDQVQLALGDHDRLFARTQKLRHNKDNNNNNNENDLSELIFDDEDFLRVLCKDWTLTSGTIPTAASKLALTKVLNLNTSLHTHTKKHVDWRQGKGRTIKYDVHPKLVGLCPPRKDPQAWSDARVDELIAGLLGQHQQVRSH